MVKKKTFILSPDESTTKPPSERFYQPKKFRWCKFVVIPLLIGFILLLVLSNVDFTGNAYDKTWLLVKDNIIIIDDTSQNADKMRQQQTTRGLTCITSNSNCRLTCSGGNINNLYKELEPLYVLCGSDLELFLYDCSFPANTMRSSFLEGNFRLSKLVIDNCGLYYIENGAFQQISVKNLKSLYLHNSKFVKFNEVTFEGLQSLEILEIINRNDYSTALYGNNCLKPLNETLQTLRILHKPRSTQTFDPRDWSWNGVMSRLKEVDFSDNYFRNILRGTSFANLGPVESFNLANCSLLELPENIFDGMLESLKFLNLSQNQLTKLDVNLLSKLSGVSGLSLAANQWDCGCDNYEFLRVLQQNFSAKVVDKDNTKCLLPPELENKLLFSLELICKEELTTENVINMTSTTAHVTEDQNTDVTSTIFDNTTENDSSEPTTESIYDTTTSTEDSPITGETTSPTTSTSTETTSTSTEDKPITVETTTTSIETTTSPSFETTTTSAAIVPSTTTPTPPPTPPPTLPPPIVQICCHNFYTSDNIYLALFPSQSQFTISPHSSTSVRIHVPQQSLIFDIIHFTKYSQDLHWLLSQRLSLDDEDAEAWVWEDDKGWILALVGLGICLFIFFGLLVSVTVIRMKKRHETKKQHQQAQEQCQSREGREHTNQVNQPSSGVSLAEVQSYLSVCHDPASRSSKFYKEQYINLHMDYYEELQM
ncbi:uncharacterized protein [Musca autumnalis]|uniref:uncharacterized protein n=1 Tax=Musca autumnalis TaxID=221902 RepID=UPI003CF0FE1F